MMTNILDFLSAYDAEIAIIKVISHWIFIACLAYYLLTHLQWYHYKLSRVFFKHHKQKWHIIYLFAPLIIFLFSDLLFYPYFYCFYMPFYIYWLRHLDKPLVFTGRIKRFVFILIAFMVFGELLHYETQVHTRIFYVIAILLTLGITAITEHILLKQYARLAKEKIQDHTELTIIAITGSFGKTSLKNFVKELLSSRFQVYATPRSVNTYAGIINDINNHLPESTQIYIVEAGARNIGDILEITELVSPHYGIIGKIGSAHIEYFKNIQNIQKTKFELAQSSRLKALYSHQDNITPAHVAAIPFPGEIKNVIATLEGTSFELKIYDTFYPFHTKILGAFNAENISAAILLAIKLGIGIAHIQEIVQKLPPIPHRLNRIDANQKIILDDSFNGNIEGMLEAIRLASLHEGRKVIVTPGLIESSQEDNIQIAQAINEVFQIAIITGDLNSRLLNKHITKPQKIILKEKSVLESVLKGSTKQGDLILFGNDAPSYI